MVSSEEILGDLERTDVGVEVVDEDMENAAGYASLKWPFAREGVEALALRAVFGTLGPCWMWLRGLIGRRLLRGKVWCEENDGEAGVESMSVVARGVT